ncbi:hypothetical protein LQ938_09725 [Microbacterium sp. cx-55]|nr:hypothetical protein [Microbacterium sp. cx-55]MBZ4485960.1 hypothetical protein [Microbacterium sp. cx-55]UGB34166.1 hypothetical protein LQ938_09725 [Microbacterium sp. cx-55]
MNDLEEDRLADMAAFVVALKWTPADYWALTLAEREAIAQELKRQARSG